MKTKLHFLLIAVLFSFSSVFAAKPTVTAKSTGAVYPIVSLIGSGVGGWGVDVDLTTTDGVVYTLSNFEIIPGEVKFRLNHRWHDQAADLAYPAPVPGVDQDDWGYDKASTMIPIGFPEDIGTSLVASPTAAIGNIPSTPGFWNVTFNLVTKAYKFTVGVNPNHAIVINGGGLVADAVLSTGDGINYSKESVVFATGGPARFLEIPSPIAPAPTANWSSVGFPGGTGTQDGVLIPVAPGVYYTFFNRVTGAYSFDPTTVSMIGAMNGWNDSSGAWDMLTDDNVTFYLNGITLASAGDFKFRDNYSWNYNYGGTTFPTGTGVFNGGTNIAYTAGKYNVTFNRITLAYTFTSVNPNFDYNGTTSTPANVHLGTVDGTNYVGTDITFSAAGAGTFDEIASAGNPGPTFATWPAVTSPAAGFWNVKLNKTTGVNSFVPTVVGLIGDFTASGWGTDIDFTSVDGINYTLNNVVFDLAGRRNFKIRDNHGWTVQFGHPVALVSPATSPMSGTLTGSGGQDMWLAPGTYNFTFNRVTLAYTITNALAVNKFDANKFSVYPNPTKNSWNFTSGNSDITSVKIVDMLGKTVMSKNSAAKEVSVDASSLSKGMYFAKITSGDSVQTVKVIRD